MLLDEGVLVEVDVDCVDVGVIFGVDVMVVEDELEGVVVEVDEGVVVLEELDGVVVEDVVVLDELGGVVVVDVDCVGVGV